MKRFITLICSLAMVASFGYIEWQQLKMAICHEARGREEGSKESKLEEGE